MATYRKGGNKAEDDLRRRSVQKAIEEEQKKIQADEDDVSQQETEASVIPPSTYKRRWLGSSDLNVDFRSLDEPERTLKRIEFLSSTNQLSNACRVAAIRLVLYMRGVEGGKNLIIEQVLPRDFISGNIRNKTMKELVRLNLIRKVSYPSGSRIELLF